MNLMTQTRRLTGEFNGKHADRTLARGLGWTSVAIGLTELLATRRVENLLGIDRDRSNDNMVRAMGVRELMHGAAILSARHSDRWLAGSVWSRVIGDVLDTALLGVAATRTRKPGLFTIISTVVMMIGVMDLLTALRLTKYTD
jgi:hypothetical protein